jgi:hypothetical protein
VCTHNINWELIGKDSSEVSILELADCVDSMRISQSTLQIIEQVF